MDWGIVEIEPEVRDWLVELTDEEFGHVAFYIDLLQEHGVHLAEPYTRQLRGSSVSCASIWGAIGGVSPTTLRVDGRSCC
jgi:hypothetical protein